jgi:hypothetical protein
LTFRIFGMVLLLAWLGGAAASNHAELLESAIAIQDAEDERTRDPAASVNLDKPLAVLTRLIGSGQLNPPGNAVARFWRGRAYWILNSVRLNRGEQSDAALARRSLEDFDEVVAGGVEVRDLGIGIPNTIYFAGSVAFNHLLDSTLAHRYWEKCAAMAHAGCLNAVASARLTGAGGTAVDLERAIELNKQVYDSGTAYRCAGPYSALTIAQIIHFAGLKPPVVDDLAWISRAYPLLADLAKSDGVDNPCDLAYFELSEYLMRLARGERKPELLRSALARKTGNHLAPVARHLLGEESGEAFERSIRAIPLKHVACHAHFIGAWSAALAHDKARAARYVEAMTAMGGCDIDLALLRLRKTE